MNINQILRLLRPLLRRRGKSQKWVMLGVGLLIGYSFLQPQLQKRFGWNLPSMNSRGGGGGGHSQTIDNTSAGEQAILDAFANRQSDVIVQCDFEVAKLLRDDTHGSQHQKMILRLPSTDHTVQLAHNIDLAKRVPAEQGDTITVRGEYEYTDQGGVVHWTHRALRGNHPPGWIEHEGKRYE